MSQHYEFHVNYFTFYLKGSSSNREGLNLYNTTIIILKLICVIEKTKPFTTSKFTSIL